MEPLLPLFPLQLVAFPGEALNLHIFEPRYRQLFAECETDGITFGIPAFLDGKIMEVGTEMRLVSIEKKYDSGELDVKTEGVRPFRIEQLYRKSPGKLYAGAEVAWLDYAPQPGDPIVSARILDMTETLFGLLQIRKPLPEDPAALRTFELAHHVGFSLEQEYQFLCIPTEMARQAYMEEHLEKLLPVVREMDNLRKRAQLNGHFKELKPPQF
ncbi:LON peptidase substrate-binding domain-containing protein [Phaeodactylibacter luteus]|uniref:Peptidase n=1 Tax=Phaeodactylibacter luteus TaxID=1564516 RepID=A0A5C6RXK5_9BACT|nr:LON peptidase substrate-binding domain-containing protein [Phaeodactylibacter luteus]TXB66559.1 peptidase [Phaeodactylibacter luteus]